MLVDPVKPDGVPVRLPAHAVGCGHLFMVDHDALVPAKEIGACAVLGVPMPVDEERIGALNIYRYESHEWGDHETAVAIVLADMATGYILNAGELDEARTLAEQLQHALDSRVVIEQAKGIIAERNRITTSEAFERLRQHARQSQARIHDVAAQVVEGTPTL